MNAKVSDLVGLMKRLAPEELAMEWDNVGLQIGDYNQSVNKILTALDLNQAVLTEAIDKQVDLIITHHPVIFNELKSLTSSTNNGRLIRRAIKEDIAIYVAHTNYDIVKGGLNDTLAKKIGLEDINVLKSVKHETLKKLVVFTPKDKFKEVRETMAQENAGAIGNYSHCFFAQSGLGSFKPLAGSQPYLGQQDQLEEVDEMRLETIVRANDLANVIKAMKKAHPYEEVAYDIYDLDRKGRAIGLGRIGRLKEATKLKDYLTGLKNKLGLDNLTVVANSLETEVEKIALCSGSGSDLITTAAKKGADLFITGDIKYHQAELARDLELNLVDAGHYATEVIMKEAVANDLKKLINDNNYETEIIESKVNTNPMQNF